MLAAKAIEDSRIGGSPLEKSTRYIFFDQKVKGEYLFYREPILMTSAYRDIYLDTCNMLFETYSQLIPPLTTIMEREFPRGQEVSQVAYNAALRPRSWTVYEVFCLLWSLTNMGVFLGMVASLSRCFTVFMLRTWQNFKRLVGADKRS